MPDIYYVHNQFVMQEQAVTPTEERGHQFGDGIYEVVRVYGGRPFLLDWHLERLDRSCRAVGIDNPHTAVEWTALIGEAIRRSGFASATVYWQVTRGVAARSHPFPDAVPAVTMTVRAVTSAGPDGTGKLLCLPDERFANAWVKTLNLLPNVIAKESAKRSGCVEALLCRDGRVTEGASTNVWFVRNHALWTHPADRFILGGVTRRFILKLAEEQGIPVHEQALTLAELSTLEGVFLTSTTSEILPISEIVVDEAVLPELTTLPSLPPQSLVRVPKSARALWQSAGENQIIVQMKDAFDDAVSRFAEGEYLFS